jgi:hypothetical protein
MARAPHAALALLSIALVASIIRKGAKKDSRTAKKGKSQVAAAAGESAAAASIPTEPTAAKEIKSYYSFMTTVIVEADAEEYVANDTVVPSEAAKTAEPSTSSNSSSSSWWQDMLCMLGNACATLLTIVTEIVILGIFHVLLGEPLLLLGGAILTLIWLWECVKPQPYDNSTYSDIVFQPEKYVDGTYSRA